MAIIVNNESNMQGDPTGDAIRQALAGMDLASVQDSLTASRYAVSSVDQGNVPTLVGAQIGGNSGTQGGTGQNIIGQDSVVAETQGNLTIIKLVSDQGGGGLPGNTYYYGTGPTGIKGFFTVASTMAVASTSRMTQTIGGNGVSTFDLANVADSGAGTLLAITRDAYGRVSGTKAATITGTAGRVTVANGDAAAGVPTIDLDAVADGGGGSLLKFVRDAWGRITGTSTPTTTDLAEGANLYYTDARVLATVLAGLSTATNAVITAADTVLSALGKLQAQITANVTAIAGKLAKSANLSDVADAATARGNLGVVIPQGYIDGLQMVWNSATSISVTSGAAYIPSLGNVLASNSALTLSGLSLAASTWYHVYLYSNAGTPAIECVTTAPSGPYNGAARTKSGDTTRRYVGSVRTDASGNAMNFLHLDKSVIYADGWLVLDNGKAATSTPVACAEFIPVTGLSGKFKVQLNVSGGSGDPALYVCQGGITPNPATTALVAACPAISGTFNFGITFGDCAVDGSQTVNYILSPASVGVGGAFLSVFGYDFGR